VDENLPEEEADKIRDYLASDDDAELKSEVLGYVFESAFQYYKDKSAPDTPSETAARLWPRLAETLGMNPDIEHYRKLRKTREMVAGERQ
jgi:hypothetical protein